MVPNRIRDMRVQAGLSQEDVADSLPNEVTRVIVSFLEGGKVLPTVESMKGLCDLFICSPTDLYDPGELDLALAETYPDVVARPPAKKGGGRGAGHEGMTEFRVWVKPEEKAALESAVAKLGYVVCAVSGKRFGAMFRILAFEYTLGIASAKNGDFEKRKKPTGLLKRTTL